MTETLSPVPQYPAAQTSKDAGLRYICHRLHIHPDTIALAGTVGSLTEFVRRTIVQDHGSSRLMGKNPDGKVETLEALFTRVTGQPLIPKKRRA